MNVLRFLLIGLVVLLALGWVGQRHLLGREAVPETSTYELDLAAVRAAAGSQPGARPQRVNEELIAESGMPRAAIFAGESFDPWPMVHRSFQLVWEDRSLVIDAAMGREMAEQMAFGDPPVFHEEAYARMQQGMERAETIVFTHEHQDHIDGAARGNTAALKGRVRFNVAQKGNRTALELVSMPLDLLEGAPALPPGRYTPVAPGVVLIEAAGHTPGSQMVYVALRDGRELLFLGDVAWHMRQIEELHYRPRLITDLFLGEDRAAVLGQFRTLHELNQTGELEFVVSHDADQRKKLLDAGVIGGRFEL
ncbi:MAG: MBL fold metallo-hydrolase [Deltaproteobacteria bacterium]|nr:MBL fold metallo-hydrolase [Deltaproteobacteria bacterium]